MKSAINSEIERVTAEELEESKKRIDKRKSEIIAGVILYVEKRMQVQTLGENVVITIINKS